MRRPLHIWLVFTLSLAVLLAAMGWVSLTVVDLDRAQMRAQEKAGHEEKIRLALWRMESFLTPLLVEESARPYFHFTAFHAPEQAYTKGLVSIEDVLVPSPLMTFNSSHVLLHFQWGTEKGRLVSPQVPAGQELALASAKYTTPQNIETSTDRLRQLNAILNARTPSPLLRSFAEAPDGEPGPGKIAAPSGPVFNRDLLMLACTTSRTNVAPLSQLNKDLQARQQTVVSQQAEQVPLAQFQASQIAGQNDLQQSFRNTAELNARANVIQKVAQKDPGPGNYLAPQSVKLVEGPLKPLWAGTALLLARRVHVGGQDYIQGAWLNWPELQKELLDTIEDLLPQAALEPVYHIDDSAAEKQQLATLPARLVAPLAHRAPVSSWTPLRLSLLTAWVCILLAALAVAVLLFGVVSLSERRGAFVSAVTHELRTPLTTFKMYSEMLAEDMVPEPEQRRTYLKTLCLEANRLGHLVENVLAFARLEKGSARQRFEKLTPDQLVQRIRNRLEQRCEQDRLRLVVDCPEKMAHVAMHVDVAAVEQILFNLVDNACKYGVRPEQPRQIHLEVREKAPRRIILQVRDHGPGIQGETARRLFEPFHKSAQQAAHSAPGIGLGLALCRRLSRSLGGRLELQQPLSGGACFVLSLPQAPRGS